MSEETKLLSTYIFNPTKFKREKHLCLRVTVGEVFYDLLAALGKFCENLEAETERGALGIPSGHAFNHFKWKRRGMEAKKVRLPAEVPYLLNDLYYTICQRLQEEYEMGLSDGTDLLRRLASGEITVQDIDAVKRE